MDNTIYKKRRDNLEEILPNNSVLLLPGADLQYRNADSAHAFRQESSFFFVRGVAMFPLCMQARTQLIIFFRGVVMFLPCMQAGTQLFFSFLEAW